MRISDWSSDVCSSDLMRLAIINDDMPFLLDSIAATINAHDIAIDRVIHPVVPVERGADGKLRSVGAGGTPESMIYIELRRVDARARRDLLSAIEHNLADVRAPLSDWDKLHEAMRTDAARPGKRPDKRRVGKEGVK